jgi:hypothetical protein
MDINNNSNCWTPAMRNGFIETAINGDAERGNKGPYWFNVLPKNNKPDEARVKKELVTRALMNTIFENPQYRIIALKIYDILINKITSNPFTRAHYHRNIVVQLKGGVSYTYLMGGSSDMFPYSDVDIVVLINPNLPKHLFDAIKDTLNTLVLQTISQYKRIIDFMFFSNREMMSPDQIAKQSAEQFMSDELIAQFRSDYNEALARLTVEEMGAEGMFVSPLDNKEFRNAASRHSYILANSNVKEDSVVRVDVPHFEMCERIPLKKTPIFCSHNRTIRFNRTGDSDNEMRGSFDLYRIRFNNLFIPSSPSASSDEDCDDDSASRNGRLQRENVIADFVDISISSQDDVELAQFWQSGRSMLVNDIASSMWIVIPDLVSMMNDLYKMLHVYECPESKRAKRQMRYDTLKAVYDKTCYEN